MRAKEKAKELVDKYQGVGIIFFGCGKEQGNPCIVGDNMPFNEAKQCALIAVDEVLSNIEFTRYEEKVYYNEDKHYWLNVKQEIEKL